MNIHSAIARRFDQAAEAYDQTASVQARTAEHLVQRAAVFPQPSAILDIGCGTGFAAEAAARRWPQAKITAIDHAPAMLRQARRKMPQLEIISDDATRADFLPRFDIIFSNMMLHWLPEPRAALRRWQGWLKPHGHMYAALLAAGSFQEWRDLCAASGVQDGLWPMPHAAFADDIAAPVEQETITVDYSSAREFLHRLKKTGAATPRPGHKPLNPAAMRRLLTHAPAPFTVSYEALYLEMPSSLSI